MNFSAKTSRRTFLRAGLTGAIAAPFITRNLLADPPSRRVIHASFGASGMAWADLTAIANAPNVTIAAIAEVDSGRLVEVRKKFPDARIYQDYRVLLEKEKIDSVNVSTPDHMHAAMGMAALNHGVNVYGQKPLTHDLYETRRLTEAARAKKLVTQMGIQIHSESEYKLAVALVQSGTIGKIKEVHTWSSKEWGDNGSLPAQTDPVPDGFNWDLWLGVCEQRPFYGRGWYHPANWRKRLDFGTGTFGDMGCHIFDPVFAALALTAPVSVKSEGAAPNQHSWATNAVIRYMFPATQFTVPGTIPISWYDGHQRPNADIRALLEGKELPDQGSILIGTDGVMVIPHVANPVLYPSAKFQGFNMPKIGRDDHWHQFVEAVRGEGKTSAGFDYAGPLTESVLLGSVATRFPQTELKWDAKSLRFTNTPEANAFVRRKYRTGWDVVGL